MEARYTKEELKRSKKFRGNEDALEALLKKDCLYTIDETEEILRIFKEGRI